MGTFLYMLRISECEIMWKLQFSDFNEEMGSVTWSSDGKYAFMMAYDKRMGGTANLVTIKDPYKSRTSDGDPDVWTVELSNTSFSFLLQGGTLFAHPDLNY